MDFTFIPYHYAREDEVIIPSPILMLKRIKANPRIYGDSSATLIPTLIKRINALYEGK